MSFSFVASKSLICRMCQQRFPAEEIDFPDDLFSLISQYNLSQVHWFCESCNDWVVTPDRFRNLEADMQIVTANMDGLQLKINQMTDERTPPRKVARKSDTYALNNNLSTNRVDSTGSPDLSISDNFASLNCNDRYSPSPPMQRGIDVGPRGSISSIPSSSPQDVSVYSTTEVVPTTSISPSSNTGIVPVSCSTEFVPAASDSLRRSRSTGDTRMPRQIFQSPERSRSPIKESGRVISVINNALTIDKKEAKYNSNVVTNFIHELNPFLKENFPEYKYMYSKDYFTGSAYNDLKISTADEYDVNIVLIPPNEFLLEVELFESKAFARIKWSTVKEIPESKKCVEKFLKKNSSNEGYLFPLQVKSWFQSIIDKFKLSDPDRKIEDIKSFTVSQSGPARTIKILTEKGGNISLDLVPVFTFIVDKVFPNLKSDMPMLTSYPPEQSKKDFCSFVPKPCDGEANLTVTDCTQSWRIYLPELDKRVLHSKLLAKPTIKLLKFLRDKENWKAIASYHMVTVILWKLHTEPSPNNWSGPRQFDLFVEALESLQGYLNEKRLPYFPIPDYNMFHKLDPSQCQNISHRIQKIIKDIKKDPKNLELFFDLE